MLEFCKTVLKAVSFDRTLFEKELYKSLITISKTDLPELKNWCYTHFGDTFSDILTKVFEVTS